MKKKTFALIVKEVNTTVVMVALDQKIISLNIKICFKKNFKGIFSNFI